MAGRSAAFERFMASTRLGYEEWHDGTSYDLDALAEVAGSQRDEVERWLIPRAAEDWRDLEALLALGGSNARDAVVHQLREGVLAQRLWAARLLPSDPEIEADREAAIIAGLDRARSFEGLGVVIDLARDHASPAVIDALFRAARRDEREMAVHAAALLAFIHGHAKEAFDWDRRAFFLEFGDADPAVRERAFRALCAECGVDPARYLDGGELLVPGGGA